MGDERDPDPAEPTLRAVPEPPPGGRGAQRRRRATVLVAAVALVVVAAVAALVLVLVRGRDDGSGVWESDVATRSGGRFVTDGQTVCGADDDLLFCLDAATGERRFAAFAADAAPVAIVDGTVVATLEPGDDAEPMVAAFSPDGDELWRAPLVDAQQPVPQVVGGMVVVAAQPETGEETTLGGHDVVGLDLATGDERWRAPTVDPGDPDDHGIVGSVFAAGDLVLYADQTVPLGPAGRTDVIALDPTTGAELWRSPWERGDHALFPQISDATPADGGAVAVVVGVLGGPHSLVMLDAATGDARWRAELDAFATRVAHVDGVTVVHQARQLRAVDRDGAELWTAAAPMSGDLPNPTAVVYGSMAIEHGILYFGGSGELHEIDLRTGDARPAVDGAVQAWAVTDDRIVVARPCCVDGAGPIEGVPLDGSAA